MPDTLRRDAHAVILAAFDDLNLNGDLRAFLQGGGKAILIGESGSEYYSRAMSPERVARETAAGVRSFVDQAKEIGGQLLVAADQELGGVERLGALVSALPALEKAKQMAPSALEEACHRVAVESRALGINLFLAPILDIGDDVNPWLQGRTLSDDVKEITRLCLAFVRGIQRAGIAATAKHFPGYKNLTSHPYETEVSLDVDNEELDQGIQPFRDIVHEGVKVVMVGPAPVAAIDQGEAAATSTKLIALLRNDLGFAGVIVTSNMDIKATMRGRPVDETAVRCIAAGCDLLLLPRGPLLRIIPAALERAVLDGRLDKDRLHSAAQRVRGLASSLSS